MNGTTFGKSFSPHTAGSFARSARRPLTAAYGVLLVVFGVLACAFPLLGSAFAGYAMAWAMIAGGVAAIVAGTQHIREHGYWADLLLGVLALLFGLAVLVFPLAGAVTLLWSLSLWFAVSGVIEIAAAFHLHRGRWLQFGVGLLDLALSLVLLLQFAALDLGVVSALVGFSFIVSGFTVLFRSLAAPRRSGL